MKRFLRCLFFGKRDFRYLRKMMKAIDLARTQQDLGFPDKKYSKTHGLRVIKRFEKVNGVSFDPFNESHLYAIKGCAEYEKIIMELTTLTKSINRLAN